MKVYTHGDPSKILNNCSYYSNSHGISEIMSDDYREYLSNKVVKLFDN